MCLPSILSPFLGGVGLVVIWEGLMTIMVLSRPYKLLLKASLGAGTYLRTFGDSTRVPDLRDHLNEFLCARVNARLQSVRPLPFPHHWRHWAGPRHTLRSR